MTCQRELPSFTESHTLRFPLHSSLSFQSIRTLSPLPVYVLNLMFQVNSLNALCCSSISWRSLWTVGLGWIKLFEREMVSAKLVCLIEPMNWFTNQGTEKVRDNSKAWQEKVWKFPSGTAVSTVKRRKTFHLEKPNQLGLSGKMTSSVSSVECNSFVYETKYIDNLCVHCQQHLRSLTIRLQRFHLKMVAWVRLLFKIIFLPRGEFSADRSEI